MIENTTLFVIGGVLVLLAILRFILLPKLHLGPHTGFYIRLVLYLVIALFLAYDFYTKEKYVFLGVLALGSVAFIQMLRMTKK